MSTPESQPADILGAGQNDWHLLYLATKHLFQISVWAIALLHPLVAGLVHPIKWLWVYSLCAHICLKAKDIAIFFRTIDHCPTSTVLQSTALLNIRQFCRD